VPFGGATTVGGWSPDCQGLAREGDLTDNHGSFYELDRCCFR
jgi:hypothetical protein